MAHDRCFSIKGVAAIPIGHRVEVTVFGREQAFAGTIPIWEPLLRDLETGVVYGTDWHFTDKDFFAAADQVPFEVRRDLVIAERIVGRVRVCRIVSGKLPDMGKVGWVTNFWLTIDP